MSDYVIITDSCTDFYKELADEIQVNVIPLLFHINENNYLNDLEESMLSVKEVYKILRGGTIITTSQINPDSFINCFNDFLEQGKDILYLGFSSGLSGTFNSSLIAIEILKEKYPKRKILAIDSLCASMGEGLFVYNIALMKKAGATIDECFRYGEENKLKYCHLFTVDDLHFLKRGGRLSASAAFLGSLLKLKPLLHVNDEGKLVPYGKVIGRRNSFKNLVERMLELGENLENQTIFISHGDCEDDLKYVISLIEEKIKPKKIITNLIGPVIGSHSGPGTIAIFFIGSKR